MKQEFDSDGPFMKGFISSTLKMVVRGVLLRMILEQNYEEFFTFSLERNNDALVSLLCSEVDLSELLVIEPLLLSQDLLLRLLQRLASDIGNDSNLKLVWINDLITDCRSPRLLYEKNQTRMTIRNIVIFRSK